MVPVSLIEGGIFPPRNCLVTSEVNRLGTSVKCICVFPVPSHGPEGRLLRRHRRPITVAAPYRRNHVSWIPLPFYYSFQTCFSYDSSFIFP